MNVKSRMAELKITQVDMILELQKRGIVVQPPMLSAILRGVYTYPKAKLILAECEEILTEKALESKRCPDKQPCIPVNEHCEE